MVYNATDTVMPNGQGLRQSFHSEEAKIASENVAKPSMFGAMLRENWFSITPPCRDAIESIEKCTPTRLPFPIKILRMLVSATFDNDSVDKIVDLVAGHIESYGTKNGEKFTLEGEGCP